MKKIVTYESNEGMIFDSEKDCEDYEEIIDKIKEIESELEKKNVVDSFILKLSESKIILSIWINK